MVKILDGGLGTTLESVGFSLNDEGDKLWSARLLIDQSDALRECHKLFFDSGADIVESASYQFNFESFVELGFSIDATNRILQQSIKLVAEAREKSSRRGENLCIAASLGSYGAVLADGSEYTGNFGTSEQELANFHENRIRVILAGDQLPDYLALETVPCLLEVKGICRALENVFDSSRSVKVWLSVSCKSDTCLRSGDSIQDVINEIERCEFVDLLGFNCMDPTYLAPILAKYDTKKKLVIYPNRGERYEGREWVGSSMSDDDFVNLMASLIEEYRDRIEIVGGCCQIEPNCIHKLRTRMRVL